MLQSYTFPISYAFAAFPIAALLFTLPFLLVQYRKHGYIHPVRALVLYAFLLYLLNATFLVMLPLPATLHNEPLAGGALQLVPLQFIADIRTETAVTASDPLGWWRLLTERAFLQAAFNIVLTVPLGMLLRYYFRAGWLRCAALTLLFSLFIEITQLTGVYGLYDHPYRIFDVDDLLLNTLGGVIGFLAAGWLSGILPRIDRLDAGVDISAKRVSYTRRAVALLFDGFAWLVLFAVGAILRIPGAYLGSVALYFVLLPYATGGFTLGKWLVRIRIAGPSGGRPSLVDLTIRYGLLYGVGLGMHVLLATSMNTIPGALGPLAALAVLAVDVWFALHVVGHVLRKDSELVYEKISRTRHMISWRPVGEQERAEGGV